MASVTTLLPGRVCPRSALLARGFHPRRFSDGSLLRVLPGCYTRADLPADHREVARVLQTRVLPGAVISHASAVHLLGLPLPIDRAGPPDRIHCRVPPGTSRTRNRHVAIHAMAPAATIRWKGIVMSHPVEVLREIAADVSHDDLVACADALAGGRWTRGLLVPLEEIRARAAVMRGRGAAAVRAAVADARARVWSPMETRARLLLVRAGWPEPVANHPVTDPDTGALFVLDLAYPDPRLAIEYDGDGHRSDRRRWQRDLAKDEVLHALGWRVLRIAIADLRRPGPFLLRLAAARAGPHPLS